MPLVLAFYICLLQKQLNAHDEPSHTGIGIAADKTPLSILFSNRFCGPREFRNATYSRLSYY